MTRTVFKKGIALVALVGAFALSGATRSEAAFMAYICNDAACSGAGDSIVTDGGAGDTDLVNAGHISMSFATGGLNIVTNSAFSKGAPGFGGSPASPHMDLNFGATGVGTAWLYASDTDFTSLIALAGTFGGTQAGAGSTVEFFICDRDNNGPANFAPCTSSGVIAGNPFSGVMGAPAGAVTPYVMTIGVKITRLVNGGTTGDFDVVPEPAAMSLFGLGLAGVAALRRRQARR
jgi:hypothetical protein